VINAFSPNQWSAPSDFDTTHQLNANWVWDVPCGRGRHWGSSSDGLMNGIFGGWGLNGLYRWTSGFPFSVEAGNGWSTNFELQGSAILTGSKLKTGVFFDSRGNPTVFRMRKASPALVLRLLPETRISVRTYPGRPGSATSSVARGTLGIDAGLSKMWNVTEGKTLRFACEVFNVTNSARFDAAGSLIGQTLTNITGFGIYNTQLTTPRVMQYSLRFAF
jgi:hypothetical protein